MGLSSLFRFRKVANEAILELLESVTLGTNGAHYKHQDTSKRIGLIDNPLFLTIERNEKVIANVTFVFEIKIGMFAISHSTQDYNLPERKNPMDLV